MTSNYKCSKGFTLLEIIVVLSIIALFLSSAASFIVRSKETDFNVFSVDFQNYVRETKLLAQDSDESVYIVLTRDKIWRSHQETLDASSQSDVLEVPEGIRVSMRRKEDGLWRVTHSGNKKGVFWLFSRSGCCEVVEIKLNYGDSEYFYEYDYLTAYPKENVDL